MGRWRKSPSSPQTLTTRGSLLLASGGDSHRASVLSLPTFHLVSQPHTPFLRLPLPLQWLTSMILPQHFASCLAECHLPYCVQSETLVTKETISTRLTSV